MQSVVGSNNVHVKCVSWVSAAMEEAKLSIEKCASSNSQSDVNELMSWKKCGDGVSK